ncbi:Lin0512 family protein [Lentibacter algarum]|uniref:Lin0512 family protein n=1 Tax=Lentibacter algarum TaxID=576131 RepID=UPI001C06A1D5|nr:Lin0512 family protein [Lentibacter algarum]MBU2982284.1 Lin0512 family protein [Lentibacter algarum]
MKRLIIGMGMGVSAVSLTDAAQRAVDQALMHASLDILNTLEIAPEDVRVNVTIGVQEPADVTPDGVSVSLTKTPEIKVVFGGQKGANHIATAAVEVFLVPQSGWKLKA